MGKISPICLAFYVLLLGGCPKAKANLEAGKELASAGKVTSSYDEFKKITAVTYEASAPLSGNERDLLDIKIIAFKEFPDKGALLVLHPPPGPDWRYLKCHPLDILIDGKGISVETEQDGDVGSGYVSEFVNGQLYPEIVISMAGAKTVKARLCNDTFELLPAQIESLQGLVTQANVTPTSQPQP